MALDFFRGRTAKGQSTVGPALAAPASSHTAGSAFPTNYPTLAPVTPMTGFNPPFDITALAPLPSAPANGTGFLPPLAEPFALPEHPADLLPPDAVPLARTPNDHPSMAPPLPLATPPHLAVKAPSREVVGVVTFDLASKILEARDAIDKELARTSKEYQVFRSIGESEIAVCQDLVLELQRRLAGQPLYETILKLNEAYSLTLRYRRP